CLSEGGHHDAAIANLQQALQEHPGARSFLVALADAYARAGKLEVGIELLQKAADEQQSDELYAALSDLLARNRRGAEGIAVLQKAAEARPHHPQLLYALALAYSKANQLDRAVGTMKQLLQLEPDNANA